MGSYGGKFSMKEILRDGTIVEIRKGISKRGSEFTWHFEKEDRLFCFSIEELITWCEIHYPNEKFDENEPQQMFDLLDKYHDHYRFVNLYL